MKQRICTTPESPIAINTNGTGDRLALSIQQIIIAGPKQIGNRKVMMTMDEEEAMLVAGGIIEKLPVSVLNDPGNVAYLERVSKFLATVLEDCPNKVHPTASEPER